MPELLRSFPPTLAWPLSSYPDPFLVKRGKVWVLRTHEKDLCAAPLLPDGVSFRPAELDDAPVGRLAPEEGRAIIAALTPEATEDGDDEMETDEDLEEELDPEEEDEQIEDEDDED